MEKSELEILIEKGLSTRDMATEVGCSQGSIAYQIKKHKLKTKYRLSAGEYLCRTCGTSDISKFYSYRKRLCKACDNIRVVEKQRQMRERIRSYLGGKCCRCGYMKCNRALEVHHTDPNKKDDTFKSSAGWSWERVVKELVDCILLCSNCHREEHAEEV